MRAREGLVLVEGLRVVEEALEAGVEVRFAVASEGLRDASRGRQIARGLEEDGRSVSWVAGGDLAPLSDTESPQGLLLVCREPSWSLEDLAGGVRGRLLLLDAVQDPGNLGTLVRAARAFGLDAVVGLDGTVDPWNPKAVRAAAGASFRVPVLKASWDEVRSWLLERDVSLLVARSGGRAVVGARPEAPWALAVGNEGAGVRPGVLEAAGDRVAIPMPGGADSLNVGVAGAILLYELTLDRNA